MPFIRYLFKNFPAATRALIIALSVSLILFIGLRLRMHDDRPAIFLLGDSFVGNYRMDPGQRMQDFMERMNPGTRVENWAEPGATPLDFFLQLSRGRLIAGKPQIVVIDLVPDKFIEDGGPRRFDDAGENLRWIPWSRQGFELLKMLTPAERKTALIQQASVPFYAAADFGRALWVRYIQWPWERSRMRSASVERRQKIVRKSFEQGKAQEKMRIGDDKEFAELPRAKDAEFLLHALRDQGIETRVVVLPFGNPDLIQQTCSPQVLAKHDTIDARMRHWLNDQAVAYLDFNSPDELSHFPDSVWDDLFHPKSPAAFAYISEKISETLPKLQRKAKPGPISVVELEEPENVLDARN